MTPRPCDRCGARVADTVGKRQTSMFDVQPVDSRATEEARAEFRAGRVLCPACARTPELFGRLDGRLVEVICRTPTDDDCDGRDLLGHWPA